MDEHSPYSTDSGIEIDSAASDLESVTSKDYQYRSYGKRRYHGFEDANYPLPNDAEEVGRLDKVQFVISSYFGGSIVAPISSKPTQIVDVGCGSGAWAIQVADAYPSAKVWGVDISPVQPMVLPHNCEFIVHNLNDGLSFDTGSMDLVQGRLLLSAMTRTQWPALAKEVFRICKPGTGWAQLIEASAYLSCDDGSVPDDAPLWEYQRWEHEFYELGEGFIWGNPDHVCDLLKQAGFLDIEVKKIKIKLGKWWPDLEPRLHDAAQDAIEVYAGVVEPLVESMKSYCPDDEERARFSRRVKDDMANPSHHLVCAIGRKPDVKIDL